MDIQVSSTVLEAVLEEARNSLPNECCGILYGSREAISGVDPTRNVRSNPKTHFEIDPQALIDAHRAARSGGPQIAGYYHSHPDGPPEPSATDRDMAAGDGMIWLIAGRGKVRAWRSLPHGFEPLSLRIKDV